MTNLPLITPDEVRLLRQSGQLGRVDVYPIPDPHSPDSPSSIVRAVPQSLFSSDLPDPEPDDLHAGYELIIDGRSVYLTESAGVIGRSPDVKEGSQSIAIDDPGRSLSRNHLGFEMDARSRLLVFDLDSANGSEIITAASGERIACVAGRRYPVGVGDTVLLGSFSVGIERG